MAFYCDGLRIVMFWCYRLTEIKREMKNEKEGKWQRKREKEATKKRGRSNDKGEKRQ